MYAKLQMKIDCIWYIYCMQNIQLSGVYFILLTIYSYILESLKSKCRSVVTCALFC